ncbi:MAG TPA: hypothetical protein PLB66_06305 [Bacteroidales bacterium]|nr:hypothetical protein [Bacteroidales bacterium]
MKKEFWKKYLPYFSAVVIFILIAVIYASPILEDKMLLAGDTLSGRSMGAEVLKYKKETGVTSFWTGNMFSGMPTYQITGKTPTDANIITPLKKIYQLGLPSTIGLIFVYLIGFFILMRSFRINKWLSIIGAIAITFSSYFFIIIEAGHNNKVYGIAYVVPVVAGFVLLFQKKYFWGVVLSMIFTAFGITLHPQMTFYLFMLIGVLGFAELYIHIKEKRIKDFFVALLIFVACVGVGIGTYYSKTVANMEYVKETMRGGHSELVKETDSLNKTKGLDLDYATQWSYGIDETMTLLIPNFKGASSHYNVGVNSQTYNTLVDIGVSKKDAANVCSSMPMYWGDQPFTSGPVYVGAIIFLLFVLGLLVVKGPYKWALLVATLFSILLSWGKNFMPLTELFFNYFPMYDKFRAVSSILIVAEITIPLLGFLAIKSLMEKQITEQKALTSLYIATGITAGLSLFFALFGGLLYNFTSLQDGQLIEQFTNWFGGNKDMAQRLMDAVIVDRASMLRHDAIRSTIFILLAASVLWLFIKQKIKVVYLLLSLGILILVDMWGVNRRFLNESNFISEKKYFQNFKKQPYEEMILADNTLHFRVLNLATNTFNEARTSYYLKSIGGYHAAKLRRYQDLIDEYIRKLDMSVLNMLNTRYFIIKDNNGNVVPRLNPDAMGNAWFVDSLFVARNPNEEYEMLGKINLRNSAVTDQKFNDFVANFKAQHDSLAQITLLSYKPDELLYKSTAGVDGIVIFSEIYYPYGWKAYIDDKPVEHFRANYTLRALNVPAGEHTIRFEFKPDSIFKGDKISLLFIVIMFTTIGVLAVFEIRKIKKKKKIAKA